MIIPYAKLAAEIFDGILADLASREGTDYGEQEIPLVDKIQQLRAAIKSQQCFLVFDEESESIGLLSLAEAQQQNLL